MTPAPCKVGGARAGTRPHHCKCDPHGGDEKAIILSSYR